MKFLIAATILVISANAHATYCKDGSLIASHPNHDCNIPIGGVPNVTPNQINNNSASTSNANAAAGAIGIGGKASATGGRSDASSSATGGDSANSLNGIGNSTDNSSSSFKAFAVSLPAPVFTAALPTIADCPSANVTQDAVAIGWNFFSKAHGEVNTDNCSIIKLYNLYKDSCRYESASRVLDKFSSKLMPGIELPSRELMLDLTIKECETLKLPIVNNYSTTNNYIQEALPYVNTERSCQAPVRSTKRKTQIVKPKVQKSCK